MAKQKNTAGKKSVKDVSIQMANRRIDELRRRAAAAPLVARTVQEHLERPLDSGIRITTDFPVHRIALIVDGEDVSGTSVFDFQQQRHVSRDTALPFPRRCVLTMSCGLAVTEPQVPEVWRAPSARSSWA